MAKTKSIGLHQTIVNIRRCLNQYFIVSTVFNQATKIFCRNCETISNTSLFIRRMKTGLNRSSTCEPHPFS